MSATDDGGGGSGQSTAKSSPSKAGWVNFDEDATDGGSGGGSHAENGETSPAAASAAAAKPSSPSTAASSSGVSSARGSVNSIAASRSNYNQSSPGSLQVSEIQVKKMYTNGRQLAGVPEIGRVARKNPASYLMLSNKLTSIICIA